MQSPEIETLRTLIQQDPVRQQALQCLLQLRLPQGYIAAGFVRNLVWDHLHQKEAATALNDVDVIYFDPSKNNSKSDGYEQRLSAMMPSLNWQVRNQAVMHRRNGDAPYHDVVDAMRHWPEQETAVAVRLCADGNIECVSAFGFASLFALKLTPNPRRDRHVFEQRLSRKGWLAKWPQLQIAPY